MRWADSSLTPPETNLTFCAAAVVIALINTKINNKTFFTAFLHFQVMT